MILTTTNTKKLEELVPTYFEEIQHPDYDEQYKWDAIIHFQNTFNIDDANFGEMLKGALSKAKNLLTSRNYYPSKMIVDFAKELETETKQAFINLFDESSDIALRVKEFKKFGNEAIEKIRPGENLNHYQDDRAIAVYLSFRYPDKYFLFKSRMVSSFCKKLSIKLPNEEPLTRYWNLAQEMKSFFAGNAQVNTHLSTTKNTLSEEANFNILIQDYVWVFSLYSEQEQNKEVNIIADFATWLREYAPPSYTTYIGKSKERTIERLKEIDTFFPDNSLFVINPNNVISKQEEIVKLIKKEAREGNKPFAAYDLENSNGIPKAIIGKSNYFHFLNSLNKNIPGASARITKYWLYSPGVQAVMWEEFYSTGIMALGWDALGDLSEYPDKLSITKKLQEFDDSDNPGSKKNDSTACYEFANVVTPGDVVFVKSKQRELIGYGVVKSNYYFSNDRKSYKSCINVDWKIKGNWATDFNLVQKTLTDVTKYKSEHPDYEMYHERVMAIIDENYTPINTSAEIVYPLNQILFGPPGTGKTYNSINHALAIIEGKELTAIEAESDASRDEILYRYKTLVESGQIVFTTFHQSMCYEDFIEGIKPVELDDQLSYEIKGGIFKTIAENALQNLKNFKKQSIKKSFDEAWNNYLMPLTEGDSVRVQMKKSSFEITHVTDKTIFFDKDAGESKHSLSINTLKAMYNAGSNTIIKGGLQPYYEPLLNELLKGSELIEKEDLKNYVLIIDEINRGNVSQIFGELITLIEKDKRLGANEELTATLPYSKQKDFGVPCNLYIIGTMNTADRSVEALDTALRRRFSFVEMPPNYELSPLQNEIAGISLLNLLETINGRIEKLLDKDHLIGHSYFLSVEDLSGLQDVFQQNLIPLLQEYFYGDMAKIGLVLGEAFFEKQQNGDTIKFANFKHDAIDDLSAREVIRLKQFWKDGEFEQAIKDMVNPA